ncbi:MAG: hypothetical protein IPJ13_01625 [Saprospiraceae bacterium]|nr:hypothetical protein [Saprospiraceae bacterium]
MVSQWEGSLNCMQAMLYPPSGFAGMTSPFVPAVSRNTCRCRPKETASGNGCGWKFGRRVLDSISSVISRISFDANNPTGIYSIVYGNQNSYDLKCIYVSKQIATITGDTVLAGRLYCK